MRKLNYCILFVLFVIFLFSQCLGNKGKTIKICRVYHIDQCKRTKNSSVSVTEFRLFNPERASSIFYMEADVHRTLKNDPELEIKVLKCMTKDNLDSCEPFTTLHPSNPCQFMFMKGMMWTNFVENIEPKADCRSKKGHYILKNATLDPTLFNVFPITAIDWKLEMKFSVNANDYFVVCVDARIIEMPAL